MRTIKFCGIDTKTGKYAYGDFVHYVPLSTFPGIVDEDGFVHEIFPDSVAQLIGYDADGREVYEGDALYLDLPEDNFHKEYKATMRREALANDGCFHAIGKVYLKCERDGLNEQTRRRRLA